MSSLPWQKAVFEDGMAVMYEVTVRLYPGRLPPQRILKKEVYSKFFDIYQRDILESWEENGTFEIDSLAKKFDISLHYAVQKHVCGLENYEDLSRNVKSLVVKRNHLVHSPDAYQPTGGDLDEELDDLLNLYMDILKSLEFCTGESLTAQKRKIQSSIESKKIRKVITCRNYAAPHVARHPMPEPISIQKEESSGMSDFTKVALGVGVVGAVGAGLYALMGGFKGEEKNKGKK